MDPGPDSDPNPQHKYGIVVKSNVLDPLVFGPPGSGSVNICTDPNLGPSTSKKCKKNLDFYNFATIWKQVLVKDLYASDD